MSKPTPEGRWVRQVRDLIAVAFPRESVLIKPLAGLGSIPGQPDLIGIIKGRGIALECKAPGGRYRATPAQINFLTNWTVAQGYAEVMDSEEKLRALIEYFKPAQRLLFY